MTRYVWPAAAALAAVALVTACSSDDGRAVPDGPVATRSNQEDNRGWSPFGGGDSRKKGGSAEIGVNSLLWRASLDTISFMPLALTDSFGGVIITDWYSEPSTPNERFKVQIYILDTRLRADGIKVNVFKQVVGANGWTDAAVSDDTPQQLENAILTKARELRLATLNN